MGFPFLQTLFVHSIDFPFIISTLHTELVCGNIFSKPQNVTLKIWMAQFIWVKTGFRFNAMQINNILSNYEQWITNAHFPISFCLALLKRICSQTVGIHCKILYRKAAATESLEDVQCLFKTHYLVVSRVSHRKRYCTKGSMYMFDSEILCFSQYNFSIRWIPSGAWKRFMTLVIFYSICKVLGSKEAFDSAHSRVQWSKVVWKI